MIIYFQVSLTEMLCPLKSCSQSFHYLAFCPATFCSLFFGLWLILQRIVYHDGCINLRRRVYLD